MKLNWGNKKAPSVPAVETEPWVPRWRSGGGGGLLNGDDPSPDIDLLDRRRLAVQLARAIAEVAEQSPSSVVALVGPWGSGKTSLLEQIKASLKADARWCVAFFNPWSYSTYESAVAGFFQELSSALPAGTLGDTPRELIGKWVSQLAPLGAVGGLVGIDASTIARGAGAILAGNQSPEKARAKASKALEALSHPILVVLDDLDRLQPAELLLTFKLVRLLGRLPNVYYLLAYDESTLEDTLERTDLIGKAPGRARQYLEKMVQVRLDIPPMLDSQKISLMNMGLDDICQRRAIELTSDADERIQAGWVACLWRYMDQPRAIKLLFAQLDAMWVEVEGEVDFSDFLHVTFLRRFEPRVFDLLLALRSELLGGSARMVRETNQDKWARWNNSIEKCGAKHPEAVAGLLAEMFIEVRGARDNMAFSGHHRQDARRRFGIDCAEFFDRYVQVGVPEGDVSQVALVAAVEALRENVHDGKSNLQAWLVREPELIVSRLQDLGTEALPRVPMLVVLGDVYEEICAVRSMLGSPGHAIRELGRDILAGCEASELRGAIRELAESSDSGLTLAADLVLLEGADGPTLLELKLARVDIAQDLRRRVQASAGAPLDGDSRLVHDAWNLRRILGPDAVRELLWQAVGSTSIWTIEDLLGLLVPRGTSTDGRRTWASLGELSVGNVDDLLGLDAVLQALPNELPEAGEMDEFDRRRGEVSMEERKRYALKVMSRERSSRDQAKVQPEPDNTPASEPGE